MDSNSQNKIIRTKLLQGMMPKDVAELLDIPVDKVYYVNQSLNKEKIDKQIHQAKEIPGEVLDLVVIDAQEKTPRLAPMVEKTVKGLKGLKILEGTFQDTMKMALERFQDRLQSEDIDVKEVKLITDTVAAAYEKMFAVGTNIHIGDNNNMSSQRLTVFKNRSGA